MKSQHSRSKSQSSSASNLLRLKQHHLPKNVVDDDFQGGSEASLGSVENNTNLNWATGRTLTLKKKKLENGEECTLVSQMNSIFVKGKRMRKPQQLPALDFYESSHFFIDQLKDQYFQQATDGWLQAKKEADSEDSDIEAEGQQAKKQFQTGRWKADEHERFLEALRRFGKDWNKVEVFVRTRPVKNIIAHGQKFLVRLVKFLEKNEKIEEMSLEEAEYFHGLLSKKTNWMKQLKEKQEEEKKEGNIFTTAKYRHHNPPKQPIPPTQHRDPSEKHTALNEWREKVLGSSEGLSFHKSLGFSIKIDEPPGLFRFKSVFRFGEGFDKQSEDSADSMSLEHLKKFSVDEGFEALRNAEDLSMQFSRMMLDAFTNIPDIEDANATQNPFLMIKFHNGLEFDALFAQPVGMILTNLHRMETGESNSGFAVSHPNLVAYITRKIKEMLHDDDILQQQEDGQYPLFDYMKNMKLEEFKEIVEEGFTLYYKRQAEEDESMASLDLCTNFEQSNKSQQ